MTHNDISTIYRFLGVIEGVVANMPRDTQSLVYGYIEAIDAILDREE